MPWAFTGGPVDVGHGRYGCLDAGNGAEVPWAFTGGPVDVGHGRYGRLDAGNGAEVPGRAQKRAERHAHNSRTRKQGS